MRSNSLTSIHGWLLSLGACALFAGCGPVVIGGKTRSQSRMGATTENINALASHGIPHRCSSASPMNIASVNRQSGMQIPPAMGTQGPFITPWSDHDR